MPGDGEHLSSLIVNQDAFKAVNREISKLNSEGRSVPQPVVIIGEEGAGKTTLLRRLALLSDRKAMPSIWMDGRTIFSSEDIISQLRMNSQSVIFIDDMDFYFTRCSYEEQYKLRKFLYNEGASMLVASVKGLLPALSEYKAPFFEGVKLVYLNPIDLGNILSDFTRDAFYRIKDLFQFLPPTIKSLQTAAQIISKSKHADLDICELISTFSSRYRVLYENLPVNSQRILNALASDGGMTIPELREKSGLPTNMLTPYIKSLWSAKLISMDRKLKRKTVYSIVDPLLKLWLANKNIDRG